MSRNNIVVIPAAGTGRRMNSRRPKQYLPLRGKPVILHTLEKFEHCPDVHGVVIAVDAAETGYLEKLVAESGLTKVRKVVPGGTRRQDSVRSGFRACGKCDVVLVHDAVRPFVTPLRISEVIAAAETHGAAILAVPAKDTVKISDSRRTVESTPDRDRVWLVQTPQAFRYEVLKAAFEKALREGFYGTDDSMLVENLGKPVQIVPGDYSNIKLTSPEDLKLAEQILAGSGS